MRECTRLLGCEFFQIFNEIDTDEIERLKELYCKGPYVDQCVRKMYKELHGSNPADHITPEGRPLTLTT